MRVGLLFLGIMLVGVNAFGLEIKSEVFDQAGYIPDRYTCDAQDFSPPVSWKDIPQNTVSLVLICDDPDAPLKIFTHWVLFNIPKEVSELKENISTEDLAALKIIQGINDFGTLGYRGPCPPSGKAHRYHFKLYALDTTLSLNEGATNKEVVEAMQGHIVAEAKIVGLYQR